MLLFKNANVIFENEARLCDVLVKDSKIAQIGEGISCENAEIIDCDGLYPSAGLIVRDS